MKAFQGHRTPIPSHTKMTASIIFAVVLVFVVVILVMVSQELDAVVAVHASLQRHMFILVPDSISSARRNFYQQLIEFCSNAAGSCFVSKTFSKIRVLVEQVT